MTQAWRLYGRAAEAARLRAALIAPGFDMIALRGCRGVGKTELLYRVMEDLPKDRPVVLLDLFPARDREELRQWCLDFALQPENAIVAPLFGPGRPELPELLDRLLRHGVGVIVEESQFMMSDGLPGLAEEVAAIVRKLRHEAAVLGGRQGVRGTLVLAGVAWLSMRDLLAVLGPDPGASMTLGPWPAATLVSVARDRGWMEHPRRLALLRTAFGGRPLDWERFARTPAADFAASRDDDDWRHGFARYLVDKEVDGWQLPITPAGLRREFGPDIQGILDCLAGDEEREIDTAAIHAALPDTPPDRLDGWLAVMSEDMGLVEQVPAEDAGGRRWRICAPRLRFWLDALRDIVERAELDWGFSNHVAARELAERLRTMEGDALAQFRRDCGAVWPAARAARSGGSGKAVRVERRAFAFSETAPGVLEGLLVPYGAPMCIGGAFEEVFEPGSVLADGLLVHVRDEWDRPLARSGKGLELDDGPGGLRATVTLPDTNDGRRVRARVEAGELTAFSAAFQALEEDWPAADRRIVRRARLVGLALVDRPEHESPLVDGVRPKTPAEWLLPAMVKACGHARTPPWPPGCPEACRPMSGFDMGWSEDCFIL